MQIFLCHASIDKPIVTPKGTWLSKNKGIEIWLDNWSMTAGDSLINKIGEGIESSDRLIVFLSPSSIESSGVKKEIAKGLVMEIAEGKGLRDRGK